MCTECIPEKTITVRPRDNPWLDSTPGKQLKLEIVCVILQWKLKKNLRLDKE